MQIDLPTDTNSLILVALTEGDGVKACMHIPDVGTLVGLHVSDWPTILKGLQEHGIPDGIHVLVMTQEEIHLRAQLQLADEGRVH